MRILMILFYSTLLQSPLGAQTHRILFPQIEGWSIGTIDRYGPENLYNAINGGSELYLKFNFEEMVTTDYKLGNSYITVELYKHASSIDAFGVYSMERPQEDKYCAFGVQGFREADYIYFVAGQFYIKIRALKVDEQSRKAIDQIATIQAERLNKKATFPLVYRVFPEEDKVKYSEKYINESILGYGFLKHSYEVTYRNKEHQYTLFVLKGNDEADATAMLLAYQEATDYIEFYDQNKCYCLNDRYNGTIAMTQVGEYLFCARGDLNDEEMKRKVLEMAANTNIL